MTRVVCQVLVHPERVTLRWSDGDRHFEPYWLEQAQLAQFWSAVETLKARLVDLAQSVTNDEERQSACYSVAQAGHELYRHIFVQDHNFADLTKEIQEWLQGLRERGELDHLEIVGDTTGLVPWQAVFETEPDEATFGGDKAQASCVEGFWGSRYRLAVANRVNAFRAEPVVAPFDAVLVVDPYAKQDLASDQRERLESFAENPNVNLVESVDELKEPFGETAPDVVYLLCRADKDKLFLGEAELSLADFRTLLMSAVDADVPWNQVLVFVAATTDPMGDDWNHFRRQWLNLRLGGLALPDQVASLPSMHSLLFDVFAKLCEEPLSVAEIAQQLREASPVEGLLCSVLCPPTVKFLDAEDEKADATNTNTQSEQSAEDEEEDNDEDTDGTEDQEEDADEAVPPSLPSTEGSGFPETPYRPLVPFDQDERLLLVGRDRDTQALSEIVDSPDVRMGFLHGRIGVGKSSLLRAGVIPHLQDQAIGYQGLRNRSDDEARTEDDYSVIAVRSTQDLVGQLAISLRVFAEAPFEYTTPTGRTVIVDLPALLRKVVDGEHVESLLGRGMADTSETPETFTADEPKAKSFGDFVKLESNAEGFEAVSSVELRAAALEDSELVGRVLLAFSQNLPHELVVLIEHGEELYSLTKDGDDIRLRQSSLATLRSFGLSKGHSKILFSIRTEYLARLRARLEPNTRKPMVMGFPLRAYLLSALNLEQLIRVIELPTTFEMLPGAKTSPREVYRFDYAVGLADQIAAKVLQASNDGVAEALPLVHVICSQLYDVVTSRPERTVTEHDLNKLGGVAGALVQYFKILVRETVSAGERKKLQVFLGELVSRQSDGAIVRNLVSESDATASWKGRTPLEQVVTTGASEEVGLFEEVLVIENDEETSAVSLSHDCLAFAATSYLVSEERKWSTSKAVVDTLFICVPILILVTTYFFVSWVQPYWSLSKEYQETAAKLEQAANTNKALAKRIEGNEWRHYADAMHRAKIASEAGDFLRMRQLLGPYRGFGKTGARGFEWYYLWKKAHPSRYEFPNHLGNVLSLAVSSDGKFALSGGADGQAILWSLGSGRGRPVVQELGKGGIHAVAFPPDSEGFAVAVPDAGHTIVFLSKTGEMQFGGHTKTVRGLMFTKKGATLVSASEDATIRFWDTKKGKVEKKISVKDHPVKMFAASHDRKKFATSTEGKEITIWNAVSKSDISTLTKLAPASLCFALSPDGGILATSHKVTRSGMPAGQIRFWNVATGKEKGKALEQESPVTSLAFTPDGASLLTGAADHGVRVWNNETQKLVRQYVGHLGEVNRVIATPNGKSYVSAGKDRTIRVWDVRPPVEVIEAHKDWICTFAVSGDDKLLATGTRTGEIKIWDLQTGQEKAQCKGHKGSVLGLAFFAANKKDEPKDAKEKDKKDKKTKPKATAWMLASAATNDADQKGELFVWDANNGKLKKKLSTDKTPALSRLLATKDKLLVGRREGRIEVWDTKELSKLEKYDWQHAEKRPVLSMAVSFDGEQVVSGDDAGHVYLWDLPSQRQMKGPGGATPFRGQRGAIRALAISPNGIVASASSNHTIKFWHLH